MDLRQNENVQTSYDRLAEEYVQHIYDELAGKPLDRALLDAFAEQVREAGQVCDLGCGPGQVARYLASRGVDVIGVDLSPGMIREAARLNPGFDFMQGDMLALAVPEGAWAGIAAFYAIVHFTPEQLQTAFAEMWRALQPGGLLLLAFHIGEESKHVDDLWGVPISLDFRYFLLEDVTQRLQQAQFVIEATLERTPYEGVEYPSRRAYIFARKPLAEGDTCRPGRW